MDTLTHIALGACIGEAFAGKQLGKKAMLWGIVAQSFPDVDFFAATWLNTADNLLAHRGFTHSLLFALLLSILLGLLAEQLHRPHNISLKKWGLFFFVQIFIHIFIDAFNNYGVGWFEPFSHQRISFNAIYVADPFFSVWTGIAFLTLLIIKKGSPGRKYWWRFGVIMSFFYLGYCVINKLKIDSDVKHIFQNQGIAHTRYFTTPAPFQNWLWFVAAGNDDGYYIGYRSVFDSTKTIDFHFFPRNDSLLKPVQGDEDLQQLIRFSQQFYTVEKWKDTLVFNDLRFGQIIGWKEPAGRFAFHYYLQQPDENSLVVQRGRFEKLDWEAIKALLRRIRGN